MDDEYREYRAVVTYRSKVGKLTQTDLDSFVGVEVLDVEDDER